MAYFGGNRKIDGLVLFDDAILEEIQYSASRGLSRQEILEGYSIAEEDLTDGDLKAFNEYYNYGRVVGIRAMSDALFLQSKSKGGTAAALAYLLRFGANFPPISEGGSATLTIKDETGRNVIPDANVKIS